LESRIMRVHSLLSFAFLSFAALSGSLSLFAGCTGTCDGQSCDFTESEWGLIRSFSPLPDPAPDPTNHLTQPDKADQAVALGQKLFFETRYSGALKVGSTLGAVGDTGKVACASCHTSTEFFVDTRSVPNNLSVGATWTTRSAPVLVNVVYYKWHGWAGKQDSLWQQAGLSPETGSNTAGDRCAYAHMLWTYYRDEYDDLFPETPLPDALDPDSDRAARFPAKCKPKANAAAADGPWEMMTADDRFAVLQIMANQGKAVATYESRLISRDAPFDRFVAGDATAISDEAKEGLRLFLGKAACSDCHNTPFFTDQKFHNLGVPQTGPNVPATDQGRFEDVSELLKHPLNSASPYNDDPAIAPLDGLKQEDADKGRFRTATLRSIAKTAPYMHDGAFASLRDVIDFYNRGGGDTGLFVGVKDVRMAPLLLTDREIQQLIAFLETLTGEPVAPALTVNPFQM
jgi:cytochrome c peroxidase